MSLIPQLTRHSASSHFRVLFGIAVFFLAAGCASLTIHSEHFTYRDSVTIDEERLRLDGYYWNDRSYGLQVVAVAAGEGIDTYWTEWAVRSDTVIQPIVLWQDGTAAYFEGYSGGTYRRRGMVDAGNYQAAHNLFQRHFDQVTGERAYQHPMWGAFRLRGDSISIQVMMALHNPGGTLSEEYGTAIFEGTIESDTSFTLTSVSIPALGAREPLDWKYRFHPLESKPPSSNWTQRQEELQ